MENNGHSAQLSGHNITPTLNKFKRKEWEKNKSVRWISNDTRESKQRRQKHRSGRHFTNICKTSQAACTA